MSNRRLPAPLDGVVAVVRANDADRALRIARGALRGGCTTIEITCTTPDAPALIRALGAETADDPAVRIGAGTVRTSEQVEAVLAAGAQFIVSPHTDATLLAQARDAGCFAIAGAMTPTEISAAWRGGAHAVKLFPAHLLGVAFLRDVRAVFPEVWFMPTGGLTPALAAEWVRAGACAVGVGSALGDDSIDAIAERTRAWVQAVAPATVARA